MASWFFPVDSLRRLFPVPFLPHSVRESLPTLLETATDKTQELADDVAAGTAALVRWSADSLVKVGGSLAEGVVRQALLPIHAQRLSTLRVSSAVKAERAALMPPPPSSTEGNKVCPFGI